MANRELWEYLKTFFRNQSGLTINFHVGKGHIINCLLEKRLLKPNEIRLKGYHELNITLNIRSIKEINDQLTKNDRLTTYNVDSLTILDEHLKNCQLSKEDKNYLKSIIWKTNDLHKKILKIYTNYDSLIYFFEFLEQVPITDIAKDKKQIYFLYIDKDNQLVSYAYRSIKISIDKRNNVSLNRFTDVFDIDCFDNFLDNLAHDEKIYLVKLSNYSYSEFTEFEAIFCKQNLTAITLVFKNYESSPIFTKKEDSFYIIDPTTLYFGIQPGFIIGGKQESTRAKKFLIEHNKRILPQFNYSKIKYKILIYNLEPSQEYLVYSLDYTLTEYQKEMAKEITKKIMQTAEIETMQEELKKLQEKISRSTTKETFMQESNDELHKFWHKPQIKERKKEITSNFEQEQEIQKTLQEFLLESIYETQQEELMQTSQEIALAKPQETKLLSTNNKTQEASKEETQKSQKKARNKIIQKIEQKWEQKIEKEIEQKIKILVENVKKLQKNSLDLIKNYLQISYTCHLDLNIISVQCLSQFQSTNGSCLYEFVSFELELDTSKYNWDKDKLKLDEYQLSSLYYQTFRNFIHFLKIYKIHENIYIRPDTKHKKEIINLIKTLTKSTISVNESSVETYSCDSAENQIKDAIFEIVLQEVETSSY